LLNKHETIDISSLESRQGIGKKKASKFRIEKKERKNYLEIKLLKKKWKLIIEH